MKPINNKTVVIPFNTALRSGKPETSNEPSIASGLGPRIKKATAPEIITEII